jgi:hypothetical protein
MQLTKKTQLILSVSLVLIVFASMMYLTTQFTIDTKNTPDPASPSVISDDVYVGKVQRLNSINRYGLNFVRDRMTFVNNGTTPITYVYYTISDTYLSYYLGINAETIHGTTLSYQEAQNSISGHKTYIVYLNTPINPLCNQTIDITTVYMGLYTAFFDFYSSNQLVFFNFSFHPFSPYFLYDVDSKFTFPYRTFFENYSIEPDNTDGTTLIYDPIDEVEPFSENILYVEGYNNQYTSLKFTSIDRKIYINRWGLIRVVEDHKITNFGDIYMSQFEFHLHPSSLNITIRDRIGTINGGSFDEETGTYAINLQNRAGINPNASMTYTLEYYLPLEEFYSRSYRVSSIKMNLNLMSFGMLAEQLNTYLYIYAGKSIISTTVTPDSLSYSDNSMVLYFHHTNVYTYTDYYMHLEYKESEFQMFARALLFSGLLIVALSMYVLLRTKKRSQSDDEEIIRDEVIPEAEMREFISYYEELTAVRIDIKQLESDLSRKKVAKKTFTKQMKVLESKLKTTQEDLKPLKKFILNLGGPIADIVKRLDLREAELISNQDSIKLYDDRYKKGKLPSKQAYRTLRSQMVDNGEKIQRQIDRLINQMKTYLI